MSLENLVPGSKRHSKNDGNMTKETEASCENSHWTYPEQSEHLKNDGNESNLANKIGIFESMLI